MSISAAGATRRLERSCAEGGFASLAGWAARTLVRADGPTGRPEAPSAAHDPRRAAEDYTAPASAAHHFDTTGANA
ncbi:hypothetical protein LTV02_28825 [Nocardia yamanashiensis]|uniref:hypothetical protein n=1 Tax=Nocardia yamanashiensis TaxID=209247 RepID=UPI001E602274|nr:hypothetical protein [Nocardia yamanashiensis]UGT40017.1 hypothetical protein LTV02_28825 [Nocardia yamanashiensis]